MIDADATIALTGIGAVTPLGDAPRTWERLLAGDSGLEPAPAAIRRAGCGVVGPASWFAAGDFMDRNTARRMGRFSQFSVVAATMAMADAGLEGYAGDGLGVVIHTGAGGLVEAEAAHGTVTRHYRPGASRCDPMLTASLPLPRASADRSRSR